MKPTQLLMILASLAVALGLLEVGLRLADIAYPEINRLDAALGWSPRPGLDGIYAFEGRTRIRINRDGFRDDDHDVAKPAGVFRIAVLGDSLAEGREVALEKTFWKVMEDRLRPCLAAVKLTPEVLNFAVNGYGTAQQALVLERHVWRFAPDVVVLALFTGNDLWNNARALDGHPDRPYFVIEDGALTLDRSNLASPRFSRKKRWSNVKGAVFNALRTLQVVRQAYRRLKGQRTYGSLSVIEQLTAGLDSDIYRAPVDAPWTAAWQVTEAMIETMRDTAAARGAALWLVTMTNPVQVYPDPALRRVFAGRLGVDDLVYPDRRLARFAAASDIPFAILVQPLRRYAESNKVRLHGSSTFAGGHWNETGHRAAGETLAQSLCTLYGQESR